MASRIQSKDATLATTGVACLVGTMAWILISSTYVSDPHGWPQFFLNAVSAAAVLAVSVSVLGYGAYQQFVAKRSLFADHEPAKEFDYRSTGQWAVVTGATDGIGKEYARQLAADHGMDVLLVGRNPEKLRAVADMIRKECGGHRRRVMTVVADFTEDPVVRGGPCCSTKMKDTIADDRQDDQDQDDVGDRCFCQVVGDDEEPPAIRHRCTRWYPRLRAVIEGRLQTGGVGVLINCAGVCYPHPEYFAGMIGDRGRMDGGAGDEGREFTAEFCDSADAVVKCNVAAAVHACRLVLPGMLARGRGLVVNVGSASASVPAAPLMALYAATKKFLEKLSADLDAECAYLSAAGGRDDGHGVRVQCVRPAYVATAMLRSANPDVRVVSDDGDDGDDGDDRRRDADGGDTCWWTVRKKRTRDGFERWLVPSARRWVRSALRQGGRLYAVAAGSGADRPANFTGYWPHTLLVWCARVTSALTPGRWFVNRVLMPGMLSYRTNGRLAGLDTRKKK